MKDDEFGSDVSDKRSNIFLNEGEFFNDEKHIKHTLIGVRRVTLPKSGEDWEILCNNKVVVRLKGTRFTNAEKSFLRTVDGLNFLMQLYKQNETVSAGMLKQHMKSKKVV